LPLKFSSRQFAAAGLNVTSFSWLNVAQSAVVPVPPVCTVALTYQVEPIRIARRVPRVASAFN
jgi:hypothetical protein